MIKYILITPAKDEAKYIEFTLKSVISQSLVPIEWIIVDDGSLDETFAIASRYSGEWPWIKVFKTNTFQDERSGGEKVVRAFNFGLTQIESQEYDFIVKLDADLTLPNNYFEEVFKAFELNPKLGLCGGFCVNEFNGNTIREYSSKYHVRGAFKTYRKKCFQEIGGLKPVWNWDGIDELTAMYKGWETKVLELEIIHHRPTSKAYNLFKHSFKSGLDSYRSGSDFGLSCIRCIVRLKQKPIIIGGFLFLFGFLFAWLRREEKYIDKDLAMFIRKFHYKRVHNIFKINNLNDRQ
jgi:poly-beta-1,6-N-acetyl-D-glucosamine synthase